MGLRINTNVASIAAQSSLGKTQRQLESAMMQLSSGSRFAKMDEGAGDFAIAEHLRGQVKSMEAARNNASNASSFVQVAEGGLNEQNNILIRQRELAIQAASDTFSDNERGFMDSEYQQLGQEFDRIAQSTTFGSQKLLAGDTKEYEFQVGAYSGPENIIKYKADTNTTASAIGVSGTSVADKSDARDSLENVDAALEKIAGARANFGAMQSRLESVVDNSNTQITNLTEAHSKIADTDYAKAVSEMVKAQALQQYQVAVLNQANQYPSSVLKLIG